MAAQTIFFVGDKFHFSQTAPSVYGVSSTANGYNQETVRDTSWNDAWKPSDSASDEYIQIDGGSAGWLGTTGGDTIYCAIAYDARGCGQSLIKIATDNADAAGGAFATIKATFTLDLTFPNVDYQTFSLAASGKRYYRIYQYNADRTGTKTVPIYAIAFFTASEVFNIDTGYTQDRVAPGSYDLGSHVGFGQTAGGMFQTNRNGAPYQDVEINMARTTRTLWDALAGHWFTWHGGGSRAFWLQYEALYNPAKSGFGMVYQPGFKSSRVLRNLFDTRLQVQTMPRPI